MGIVLMLMLLLSLLPAAPSPAQTTCFTDPHGTTLCSSPDGIIQGSTSSIGTSIYRDDRGNRLEFHSDPTGKASVQLPDGESINWSQPAPEQNARPTADGVKDTPADRVVPGNPAFDALKPGGELPGKR